MSKLDICPFCGHREVKLKEGIGTGGKHMMVACDYCRAVVSFEDASTKASCTKAWNRRTRWES